MADPNLPGGFPFRMDGESPLRLCSVNKSSSLPTKLLDVWVLSPRTVLDIFQLSYTIIHRYNNTIRDTTSQTTGRGLRTQER